MNLIIFRIHKDLGRACWFCNPLLILNVINYPLCSWFCSTTNGPIPQVSHFVVIRGPPNTPHLMLVASTTMHYSWFCDAIIYRYFFWLYFLEVHHMYVVLSYLMSACRAQERLKRRNSKRATARVYHSRISRPDGSTGWQGQKDLHLSARYTREFGAALFKAWSSQLNSSNAKGRWVFERALLSMGARQYFRHLDMFPFEVLTEALGCNAAVSIRTV